jgi:zinc protease
MKSLRRCWALGVLVVVGATHLAAAAEDVAVRIPPYERVVLDNGATLLLLEQHEVPMIGFTALLNGGALADAPGREGTAALLAALLEKGAGRRDAYQFADAVANVGGTLSTDISREAIAVSGEFLARDADLMVELLADLLRRPRLDAEQFADLRERQIDFLRNAKDSARGALTGVYGAALLFGPHPYGRPTEGSEASLGALSHDDVVEYYRQQFGADRLVLAVAGDFDTAKMRSRLERALGDWSKARAPAPSVGAPADPGSGRVLLVDAPSSDQTYFWLGSVGVDKRYPRRAALDLVNTLFGGRFTSMLNTELRVKSGLTYSARSQLARDRQSGSIAIVADTRTDATREALDLALATLDRLHSPGIDAAMLDSARAYITGQYPLGLETASQWADVLAQLEFYGLGREYIDGYAAALRAVDVEQAARVIDEVYPRRNELAIVLIGDAAALREIAGHYGDVTEMRLSDPAFSPADPESTTTGR